MQIMSQLIALCRVILDEHFGDIVGQVGETLLKENAPLSMLVLRLQGKVKSLQVRKALVVLEQHHLLKFALVNAQRIIYSINPWDIVILLKAPRCGLIIKTLYQDTAEAIFEEIFKEGRLTLSALLQKIIERDPSKTFIEAHEKFTALVQAQFLIREAPIDSYVKGCPIFGENLEQYSIPNVPLKKDSAEMSHTRKRKAEPADPDAGVFWKINWIRFERYLRDELIIDFITGPKTNTPDGHLRRSVIMALLKFNETRATCLQATETLPISIFDVIKTANDTMNANLEKSVVEYVLTTLVDESNGVLRKVGDSSGGLYLINYAHGMLLLAQSHIESLIQEQLDAKAVRIFRHVQQTGYLEEDQIEKTIMLNPKETRELLYAMNEENYIFVKPLGKTSDFAPARTFYLYHTDISRTVGLVEETTCRFLLNLMLRRRSEEKEHHTLLSRDEKMKAILANVENNEELDEATRAQQAADIEHIYMSDADRILLKKYKASQKKLMASEIEIERVLYVLHAHLAFAENIMPVKRRGRGRKSVLTDI